MKIHHTRSHGERVDEEEYKHPCSSCEESFKSENGLYQHHDVHHIKPIREFDTVEDAHFKQNVVLLCESCHKRIEALTLDDQRQLFGR